MNYGTEIRTPAGVVVRASRNLRGMRDYARVSPVVRVDLARDPGAPVRGVLAVTYADGCTCVASFASYHIAVDWVRARRTWRGAEVSMVDPRGYLTRPGLIAGGA